MKDKNEEYKKKFKKEITTMVGKKQSISKKLLPEGMTRLEFFALIQIRETMNEDLDNKGIHVSDLAKKMDILLSSASRTLSALEKRGLIYREIDRENRRNIRVFLTEKGEKTCEKCFVTQNKLIERVIDHMGKEDMDTLIKLWKRFSNLLEKEVDLIIEEKNE